MEYKYFLVLFIFLFTGAVSLPGFASAISVKVNIPANYSEIKSGTDVYFETDIKWPENDGRKDLRIEYSVKGKNGNEVAYSKVLKAVETQASFMDNISIPVSVPPGMYKITANLNDYKDLNQEAVASFYVARSGDSTMNYLFAILGVIGAIGLFMIVELFVLIKKKSVA
jgi:hypothetical protein